MLLCYSLVVTDIWKQDSVSEVWMFLQIEGDKAPVSVLSSTCCSSSFFVFYELPLSCCCRPVLSAMFPQFGKHVCRLHATSDLPGRRRGGTVSVGSCCQTAAFMSLTALAEATFTLWWRDCIQSFSWTHVLSRFVGLSPVSFLILLVLLVIN